MAPPTLQHMHDGGLHLLRGLSYVYAASSCQSMRCSRLPKFSGMRKLTDRAHVAWSRAWP